MANRLAVQRHLDCADPARLASFWAASSARHRGSPANTAIMLDGPPSRQRLDHRPRLTFQRVPGAENR